VLKLDGYRILAQGNGCTARLASRAGNDFAASFSAVGCVHVRGRGPVPTLSGHRDFYKAAIHRLNSKTAERKPGRPLKSPVRQRVYFFFSLLALFTSIFMTWHSAVPRFSTL
jgi:hypothetical protein